MHELPRSTLFRFWRVIVWGRFGRSKSRVSHIRDPLFYYLHRGIATSIAPPCRVASSAIRGISFICFILYGGVVRPPSLPRPVVCGGAPQARQVIVIPGGTSRILPTRWASFPKRIHHSPRRQG
ncbi:hypothetical protein Hanom_Chr14g01268271 [Helianthus anomalus]